MGEAGHDDSRILAWAATVDLGGLKEEAGRQEEEEKMEEAELVPADMSGQQRDMST